MVSFLHNPIFHLWILLISFTFLCLLSKVNGTEVTELTWVFDRSLGIEIGLPVLTCHAKYIGYKEVYWYKDYKLLRSGPADLTGHILALPDLLRNDSTVQFQNPYRLQGYYWCETDHMNTTVVHRYLFRIREISTFVGRFLAAQDSLGEDRELNVKEKISWKKMIYENEMQEILFGFIPKPNMHVSSIRVIATGLEIRFYLFVRRLLHPRIPFANELVEDQHELETIFEYLNNETSTADLQLHQQITYWTKLRGISIKAISLRSTLGCYQDVSLVPAEPPKEVTWPYALIGEVVIPDEVCSSKNGLSVTRICTGSYYNGARWGNPSSICNKLPNKLTTELRSLYIKFGDDHKPVYIEKLNNLTRNSKQLTATDLHLVLDILTELSEVTKLQSKEIEEMFSVVDHIMETNTSELHAAKSTLKLTSRLLRIIDNILRMSSVSNNELLITQNHILLDTKRTKVTGKKDGHIIGISVFTSSQKNSLKKGSVEFLTIGGSFNKQKSLAFFLLPPELVTNRENETKLSTQINIVYFKDWLLFPNPQDILVKRNYKVLSSPVLYVSLSGGPAWNLSNPVRLFFRNEYESRIENPLCLQFDPLLEDGYGGWSTEGCEYGGLKGNFHACLCHHLSIFSVALSENPNASSGHKLYLGTSVYVGCALSIIALLFTVILYMLSKVWRSTVDHSVLFCLAVSLLLLLVILFISEMKFIWKPGCVFMALLLQYMILVVFGWLLVQALMNRLRFANKTDMAEVPHFVLKSAFCVWGVPVVIMLIIWLTKDFHYNKNESCWKPVSDVSKVALIPIILILLIALCINLCAIYAVTCRFRKDYLVGNSSYDESVLKFRIAMSIYFFFVISWIFGFFALNRRSRELRILFSISITITSIYVTLFFIFHEVSLGELYRKWKQDRNKKASEEVQFVAEKEKYTEEQKPEN